MQLETALQRGGAVQREAQAAVVRLCVHPLSPKSVQNWRHRVCRRQLDVHRKNERLNHVANQ